MMEAVSEILDRQGGDCDLSLLVEHSTVCRREGVLYQDGLLGAMDLGLAALYSSIPAIEIAVCR